MAGVTTTIVVILGLASSLFLMDAFQKSLGDVGYMVCYFST